ncbi:MAG: hypothetical protein LBU34_05280 [Planctomycetaceae bacterium]|nr:hypothetical protein [Planctomycetaceae bacterium]
MKRSATAGSDSPILRLKIHKVGNRSPILRLTIHKVGDLSPKSRLPIGNQNIQHDGRLTPTQPLRRAVAYLRKFRSGGCASLHLRLCTSHPLRG